MKYLGLKLPHAYDPVTGQPSFRLLCAYVGLILAVISLVALHFNSSLLVATITTLCFWVLAMIFYMIKKLTSAKIDLDDRSISLNDNMAQNDKIAQKSQQLQEKGQKIVDNPDQA